MTMMKQVFQFCLMIIFVSFFIMCSDDDNPTEPNIDTELVGEWKVSKMSWSSPSESGSYSQEQLDSLNIIWRLIFNADKTAQQITNIEGPTITQEGTWATNGDVLTFTLKAPYSGSINFKYVIANYILTLDWSIPSGTDYFAEFNKQ